MFNALHGYFYVRECGNITLLFERFFYPLVSRAGLAIKPTIGHFEHNALLDATHASEAATSQISGPVRKNPHSNAVNFNLTLDGEL